MARTSRYRSQFGGGATRVGNTGIVIEDGVTPWAMMMATNFKSFYSRAIRHVGFEVQARVKTYTRRDEHGKKLSKVQRERIIDDNRKGNRHRHRHKGFAGDLNKSGKSVVQGIEYNYKKEQATAVVGFASNSLRRREGKYFLEGITKDGSKNVVVTKKMRAMFWHMARREKNVERKYILWGMMKKKSLTMKARPIFDNTYKLIAPQLPNMIMQRTLLHMDRITEESYQQILKGVMGTNDIERNPKAFAQRVLRQQERFNRSRGRNVG